eukprot:RCo034633
MAPSKEKTVLAKLPPMAKEDYEEFERTVPVWGEQRAIRRKQLYLQAAAGFGGAALGMLVAKLRRNTWWVVGFAALPFAFGGSAAGHVAAQFVYPNVADNKETRFVRRLWWANKCIQGQ